MIVEFTEQEVQMIKKLAEIYHFDVPPIGIEWPDEVVLTVWDAANDFEVGYGLDEGYRPTPEGLIAMSVSDKLLAA